MPQSKQINESEDFAIYKVFFVLKERKKKGKKSDWNILDLVYKSTVATLQLSFKKY